MNIDSFRLLIKFTYSNHISYFLILISFCFFENLSAQSNTTDIKGYVIDANSGEALPYANITVMGKKAGTTTNTEGYFILVNPPAETDSLEIFYIGYATNIINLKEQDLSKPLIVKMKQVLFETETITVTAEEYQLWKKAEEVSQITFSPMQISILPSLGEVDIFRSLQLLPGISGVSDGSSGLYVRGGTPDQNLVILDGMTVYHVDHFFGFFSAFNADAIKDVQLYKGGFPAKYGGRLSSVVELTGKTGDVNKTRVGLGVNLLSANGVLEIPVFEKGSFILSARRSYTDFIESALYNKFYDFVTSESEQSNQLFRGGPGKRFGGQTSEEIRPSFYFYDLNTKFSYNLSRRDVFSLSFYTGKDNLNDTQELGGLGLRGNSEDVFGTRINEEITDWGNLGASFKWWRQWHDRFNMNVLIAGSQYSSDYDRNIRFETDDEGSGLNDSTRVFRGGGNFASEEKNRIDDVTFRLDNEWYLSQSHRIDFGSWISAVETEYVATLGDTINLFQRKNNSIQASFYLQDKWRLSDALDFTLGLRMTHYDRTDQFYLQPRASFTYALSNYIKLKGAWGKYNQYMHRITNENVLEGSRDFWLIADEDFEPGYAEHYIAGISYENKDFLLDIEAYYKDMDNLIEYSRRFRQRADYGELFFFGSGFSQGIEFLAQKKTGVFSGWVSYTLGKIEHTFPNLNNADPFPALHDRQHEVKTVGTYSLGKWSFSAAWVFASGQPYTSPEAQYYLDMLDGESQSYIHVGEKNVNRLPDYHRLDVSATRHIFPLDNWGKRKKDSWSIDLGVSVFNLYNHDNVWYRRYDLEVTPILITDVKMLGITPTVFLKLKF